MAQPQPQPQLEQPDFEELAADFNSIAQRQRSIAVNVARFQNMAAFDPGAQILEELRAVRQGMLDMRQDIGDLRQEMGRRFDEVDRRFAVSEFNSIARLSNSSLVATAASEISPLRTRTNDQVPNFPRTLRDLERVSSVELNRLLEAYNLPTTGSVPHRRRALKRFIGITMTEV